MLHAYRPLCIQCTVLTIMSYSAQIKLLSYFLVHVTFNTLPSVDACTDVHSLRPSVVLIL